MHHEGKGHRVSPGHVKESQSVDYSSKELYGESETLNILQIEEEELNELVQRRRLSVEEKDKQRFFLKREVDLLRKISLESATMLVPKKQSKIKTLFGIKKKN